MVWKQLLLVSCLSAAMFLSMLQEGSSASVGVTQVATGQEPQEGVKQVFVPESDALNFLRRNGRRSPRPPQEINEYARSQEANEQWRWRGYNGLYPPYPSDRRRV
uniref:Unique cartilage matrix-associated protein n=1 Tax=Rousettus aegyptiacus TaxID=9407 RepID=A0A7J8EBE3_ROUAE|nr:upper zone of growth plate and cartilage matrix associated [Rousettus aegyptiacus]